MPRRYVNANHLPNCKTTSPTAYVTVPGTIASDGFDSEHGQTTFSGRSPMPQHVMVRSLGRRDYMQLVRDGHRLRTWIACGAVLLSAAIVATACSAESTVRVADTTASTAVIEPGPTQQQVPPTAAVEQQPSATATTEPPKATPTANVEEATPTAVAPAADAPRSNPTLCSDGWRSNYAPIDCTERHSTQYIGSAAPPVATLPEDNDAATLVAVGACLSLIEQVEGFDLKHTGITLEFEMAGKLGGPIDGDIDCYLSTPGVSVLQGEIANIGLEATLAPFRVLETLNPGECFEARRENVNIVRPSDCSVTEAWVYIGATVLDDGPHPAVEVIREFRSDFCPDLAADMGVEISRGTSRAAYPGADDWNHLDRRTMACMARPG